MHRPALPALLTLLVLAACSKAATGPAPYQIHIAGSSAGFLLSSEVAERLMREDPDVLAPLVRAGGTGEGFARFCDKPNPTRPDILITTRRMTADEQARCAADGSADIEQKEIGTTAVVLVEAKGGPSFPGLNRIDIAKALTSNARTWADIRPGLPAIPIAIHGPTPTPAIADTLYGPLLQDSQQVRTDGTYIGHGADAGMVSRLVTEKPNTVGVIPLSQAIANAGTLAIVPLDMPIDAKDTKRRHIDDRDALFELSIPLMLVYRPHDVGHISGLDNLLRYYDKAIDYQRRDILMPIPIL